MSKWNNFNDAEDQMSYELIPHKTIAKVRLLLKKGNHVTKEWLDGYATKSKSGTSIIGLHSDNSPLYAEIGRSMIRAIFNSANSLHSKDKSLEAEKQRQIKSFADLDNLVCLAEITINDKGYKPRNEIKTILTSDHAKYSEYMDERSGKFASSSSTSNRQSTGELISDEIPF
jgi:hypothetical protein